MKDQMTLFLPSAGLGERLRPITEHIPKPLLPVLGKPLIAIILEKVAGICPGGIGLNLHYNFEAIKPGGNLGGWVDPFGSLSLDRYAEQLWLTLFARAPEVTLFDFRSLQMPVQESQRGAWQGQGTSLNLDTVTAPARLPDGSLGSGARLTLAAGSRLRPD